METGILIGSSVNNANEKDKMCRICMCEKRNMVSIYSPCKIDSSGVTIDICTEIMECAKVQITPDDQLPSKICQKCLTSLHASYEFKTLCETSDQTFRSFLESSPISTDDIALSESLELSPMEIKIEPVVDVDVIIKEEDVPDDERTTKRTYIRRKPLKRHVCEHCGKVFTKRIHWAKHYQDVHGITLPPREANSCEFCHVSFPKWSELKEHQKKLGHYKKEECSVCGKNYALSYMPDHMRTHLGDRPFACNHCGQSFLYQFALKKHTLYCTKAEKTLQCSQCDKRFHELTRLRQHEKIHAGLNRSTNSVENQLIDTAEQDAVVGNQGEGTSGSLDSECM